MLKKMGLVLGLALAGFLIFVSTRESKFSYERSGVIKASPDKIFPYISQFKLGALWSPFEQADPNMKKTYKGMDGQVGAIFEFEGNSDVGSGNLELLKVNPNESVEMKLNMVKPFAAENLIFYTLTPEGEGTRFTWRMSGDGGFLGKLMSVLIDCDAMMEEQFDKGIKNLTAVVENAKIDLDENAHVVTLPAIHYYFAEAKGPFEKSATDTWGKAFSVFESLKKNSKVISAMSLYKMSPEQIYRAGFSLEEKIRNVQDGFKYEKFPGGKYLKFVLKGSYVQLPEASARVMQIIKERNIPLRDDYFIENYVNDPSKTPENELLTEILVPVK